MHCLRCAECASFHIISGPNMAGKSTCLRQVAMIAVMAHAGCMVPAKFAALQVMDRLLTRLGSADCIEHNSSSFLMEMQARLVYLSSQLTAVCLRTMPPLCAPIASCVLRRAMECLSQMQCSPGSLALDTDAS